MTNKLLKDDLLTSVCENQVFTSVDAARKHVNMVAGSKPCREIQAAFKNDVLTFPDCLNSSNTKAESHKLDFYFCPEKR